ncbi:MAG: hypothetical protein JWO62_3358 [Acidimicrobiaceae bacterium]|nr:hypothetical protein [Acidimicrobiaceae bacterium]
MTLPVPHPTINAANRLAFDLSISPSDIERERAEVIRAAVMHYWEVVDRLTSLDGYWLLARAQRYIAENCPSEDLQHDLSEWLAVFPQEEQP